LITTLELWRLSEEPQETGAKNVGPEIQIPYDEQYAMVIENPTVTWTLWKVDRTNLSLINDGDDLKFAGAGAIQGLASCVMVMVPSSASTRWKNLALKVSIRRERLS
jgi:hypothetical protein